MPAYSAEQTLKKHLETVEEVVMVDDLSTDNTYDHIRNQISIAYVNKGYGNSITINTLCFTFINVKEFTTIYFVIIIQE